MKKDTFQSVTNAFQGGADDHHQSQTIHVNTNPFTQPQMMMHHAGYSMESEEGDIEDNPALSLSSSKSNLSENSLVSVFANSESVMCVFDFSIFFFFLCLIGSA